MRVKIVVGGDDIDPDALLSAVRRAAKRGADARIALVEIADVHLAEVLPNGKDPVLSAWDDLVLRRIAEQGYARRADICDWCGASSAQTSGILADLVRAERIRSAGGGAYTLPGQEILAPRRSSRKSSPPTLIEWRFLAALEHPARAVELALRLGLTRHRIHAIAASLIGKTLIAKRSDGGETVFLRMAARGGMENDATQKTKPGGCGQDDGAMADAGSQIPSPSKAELGFLAALQRDALHLVRAGEAGAPTVAATLGARLARLRDLGLVDYEPMGAKHLVRATPAGADRASRSGVAASGFYTIADAATLIGWRGVAMLTLADVGSARVGSALVGSARVATRVAGVAAIDIIRASGVAADDPDERGGRTLIRRLIARRVLLAAPNARGLVAVGPAGRLLMSAQAMDDTSDASLGGLDLAAGRAVMARGTMRRMRLSGAPVLSVFQASAMAAIETMESAAHAQGRGTTPQEILSAMKPPPSNPRSIWSIIEALLARRLIICEKIGGRLFVKARKQKLTG